MKTNALHGLVMASASAQHPHIAPLMTLRPVAEARAEYELLIYGDIGESWWGESVTAKSVVDQLNALPDGTTQVNGRINSYGGSVADGLAIHNALRRVSQRGIRVAMTVDGVAMSSASLIAMAGDTLAMPEAALLMIHAPWVYAQGNAQALREWAKVLDTYAESMSGAYARKSGKPREEMLALLLDGQDHYYTGAQAQAAGFVDELLDAIDPTEQEEQASAYMSGLGRFTNRAAPSVAGLISAAMRGAYPRPASANQAEENEMFKRKRRLHDPAGKDGSGGGAATGQPANSVQPTAAPAPAPAPAPIDAAAVLAADRQRREAIRAHFAPHAGRTDVDVATLQRQCEDDHNVTPEAAGLRLLAALGAGAQPLASIRIEPGTQDAQATFREAVACALLHRSDDRAHALSEPAREFAYTDLIGAARATLQRAGIRVAGLAPADIAVKAMHSTSDFPKIIENVVTKSMRTGYQGEVRTFLRWARKGPSLPNFKEVSRPQLGGAPSLKRVREGGEYEHGTIGEGAEKYAVFKFGRLFAITMETIIGDDLDALTRIPQSFGASSAALESDLVYAILTGNPVMSDGVTLFHASHGNLGTATALKEALKDEPTLDPLAEMREKMMLQKGLEGRYITVRLRHLIVPPALARVAGKIVSPDFVAAKARDTDSENQELVLTVEPRLQDASSTRYFGAADSANVDTVEYSYLQGAENVYTESKAGFEVDGVLIKARHCFGAKALDWRGMQRNDGQ